MEKFVRRPKLQRYRDLLDRVTDEERRKRIKCLMAEEQAKDAPAIESDEIYVRTSGAIRSGVIWA
jgi:hypothetical protein